jgi:hypothetical protein
MVEAGPLVRATAIETVRSNGTDGFELAFVVQDLRLSRGSLDIVSFYRSASEKQRRIDP